MDEALKILKDCVADIEKAIPGVKEDALKNRKSYKIIRERTQTARDQITIIRDTALASFNKLYYAKHPERRGSRNAV